MLAIYQRTVEPSAEPLTIGQLLDFMKAAPQDAALIEQHGKSARAYIEALTGRAIVTQTWRAIFNEWPGNVFGLDKTPLSSVLSVRYYPVDGGALATLSTSVYRAISGGMDRPGFIELIDGQSWPDIAARSDAIQIEFIAGTAVGSVKDEIRTAIGWRTKELYGDKIEKERLDDLIASQRVGGWFA